MKNVKQLLLALMAAFLLTGIATGCSNEDSDAEGTETEETENTEQGTDEETEDGTEDETEDGTEEETGDGQNKSKGAEPFMVLRFLCCLPIITTSNNFPAIL
ncbi:hypothetical protein [Peribacillus glennii]|uniref:Uncharacterized protein n=1 Tax=Peribacillus glennii TaxID=2303991 RepID=A0A372LGZ4_9BACI|nr:hypothetical protein [Peribacillus glennii]RFU65349.1 hypothetical protein D0466_05490 [Peribacillus glennii]